MRKLIGLLSILICCLQSKAQDTAANDFPVKGFAIGAPRPREVDSFILFINKELATRHVNTLVLRVDYDYQFKSHPELAEPDALSKSDVKKIVQACRSHGIRIVPEINLLGHQSWAGQTGKLLEVYPQFDETPWVKIPEKYVWPNTDSLYCKSYCPLHPDVHRVVFGLVDEICDAFEADAFHAGMDEVFYIGMKKCPRCSGKDPARLFADEVSRIRDHLAAKNKQLWIWGDRLLDGKTTGLGEWEASINGTPPAIDMVPKDVVSCDWHYERADKTPVIFAAKGFNVITCCWNRPTVAAQQVRDMVEYRRSSTPEMSARFHGMMETIWSGAMPFIRDYYRKDNGGIQEEEKGQPATLRVLFPSGLEKD